MYYHGFSHDVRFSSNQPRSVTRFWRFKRILTKDVSRVCEKFSDWFGATHKTIFTLSFKKKKSCLKLVNTMWMDMTSCCYYTRQLLNRKKATLNMIYLCYFAEKGGIWSRYTFWIQVVLQLSTLRYMSWQCFFVYYTCGGWTVLNPDWFNLSTSYFNFLHGRAFSENKTINQ